MSLDLNGSSDTITVAASSDFLFTGDFSINMWFNADAYANTPYLHDYNGTNNVLVLFITSGGAFGFFKSPAGISISGGSVTLGKWHMGTVTRSGTTIRLYLDGAEVNNGTLSGNLGSNSAGPRFGRAGSSSANYFNGRLGIIEHYKGKALSVAEILSKYHGRGSDCIVDNCVFRPLLNEGTNGSNPTANQPLDVRSGKVITTTTTAVYTAAPFKLIRS